MAPRPGTDYVRNVLNDIKANNDNNDVISLLNTALARYNDSIGLVEIKKKLTPSSLLALDQYVQSLNSCDNINKEDLLKVFHWKNNRGKNRPNLKQIMKNNDDDVKRISKEAFVAIRKNDFKEGINMLSELCGVGVATATSFFAVDRVNLPFMCDEVLEAITGTREYKLPAYLVMRETLIAKGALVGMTASDLCQALWSHAILSENDVNYNNSTQVNVKKSRQDKGIDDEQPQQPSKKQKSK